jgi:hypothetical protein
MDAPPVIKLKLLRGGAVPVTSLKTSTAHAPRERGGLTHGRYIK